MPYLLWLVGLFEGEGSIFYYQNTPNSMSWRLKMKMTDEDVMRRFHKLIGVGKFYYEPNKNHKPAWNWVCYRKDEVRKVLEAFLPHLGHRRAFKAQNALDYYDHCYSVPVPPI